MAQQNKAAASVKEEPRWTPAQQQAISCRGGTVLVSAAAGSGKTAVLVQRVIEILTDREHPVDANRILVVTFSNAAAEQMKQRIQARLSELIAQNPADTYLMRQRTLLSAAHISTVHSFCLDLVRANFQLLEIPADFRLGSESEIAMLEEDIAQETIEQNYEENDGRFSDLVELVSSGRDDSGLIKTLHRLYDFVRSHPFYHRWLDEKLLMYDDTIPVGDTVWGKVIRSYAADAAAYAQAQLRRAIEEMQGDAAMEKAYRSAFESDLAQVERLSFQLACGRWNDVCEMLGSLSFQRLGVLRNYGDDQKKELVQRLRKSAQEILTQLGERLFCASEEDFLEDIRFLRPRIETLFELVLDYDRRLMNAKRQRSLLDFSDLEHFAVQLLVREENGKYLRTPLAQELSESFAFVLVDEYQDTNATQDMIFGSVSREDNLFMVGDVKQSIYRFRQAMPEIFIEKRNTFFDFDGEHYPARIILSNNFRSRAEVTDCINYLFQAVMSQEVGEIDYDDRESLTASASYPPKEDALTEVHLIENESEELSDQLAEASYVAQQIRRMLDEGFTVSENGALRPIQPKDICILLRSMKNKAEVYAAELARVGIEVWADARTGFLDTVEVSTALSILRAVDNPLIDIHLTAAMMSPVYGFTADDMAVLRMKNRSAHLYLNCQAIAQGEDLTEQERSRQTLCQDFLTSFSELRTIASSSPAHRLIQQLIDKTGLWDLVLAMKYGQTRKANLRLLIEYAQEYEAGGHKGIAGFLRFVDKMHQRGEDWPCASPVSDRADAVRIMSIHHSKGLEFPVVFVCDTAKRFNTQDLRSNMLLHSQLGFACCARDFVSRKQYSTVPMEALRLELERSMLSEEMRILYVALTRAKEKLIITSVQNQLDKTLSAYAGALTEQGKISPYVARSASCYADWMLMALNFHPDFTRICMDLGCMPEDTIAFPPCRFVPVLAKVSQLPQQNQGEQLEMTCAPDEQLVAQIAQLCTETYPDPDARSIVTKLSVSQVVHPDSEQTPFSKEPAFLTAESGEQDALLTGAQLGTAMHTFMSCADHAHASRDLEGEINRLVSEQFITPRQGRSLDRSQISRYYDSALYRRICASPCIRREFAFQSQLGAQFLSQVIPKIGEHQVTVQGIADLLFEEDGEWVLVDFKTDRISSEQQLARRYHEQLELYARMIADITARPVKERILYSLYLGREIEV